MSVDFPLPRKPVKTVHGTDVDIPNSPELQVHRRSGAFRDGKGDSEYPL